MAKRSAKQSQPIPATNDADAQATASREVRVLSVHQPWSDGIVNGWKVVENRTWETPYRGRIYIHASKLDSIPDRARLVDRHKSESFADEVISLWSRPGSRQTGAIIGSVDLVDIVPMDLVESLETCVHALNLDQAATIAELRDSFPEIDTDRIRRVYRLTAHLADDSLWSLWSGPFCWILERPKVLAKPIPTGGKLNLWKFTLPAGVDG